MKPKISVTIITLNEEVKLPRCLESVKDLTDEVVVVDSGSTDKTVNVAGKFGAKVYLRKFDNYSNQKNYAASRTLGDWILSVDADEVISKELAGEIKESINNPKYSGFSMPRKNIILGKFIKHTRWQPELDRHVWLWRKGKGKWVGDVHEELKVDGKVGKLRSAKIHYQDKNIKEFLEMIKRYSEIEAKERIRNGVRFSYFRFFFDPLYNFLVRYVYRLGFLDGWRGFVLSILMAYYHLELWIKIWKSKVDLG